MTEQAQAFKVIEAHRHQLTRQQLQTLRGQVKAGNPDAALRGLDKILERSVPNERE